MRTAGLAIALLVNALLALTFQEVSSMPRGRGLSTICGGDAAPPAAVAAGLVCEVYRWGTGDTIAEIAPPGTTTASPQYKWYPDNGTIGYTVVGGEYTVNGSGALTVTPSTLPTHTGPFILNTCSMTAGAVGTPTITDGIFFSVGYYLEAVMTWNFSPAPSDGGKPGMFGLTKSFLTNESNDGYELDNPDGLAFAQAVVHWNGGSGANNGPGAGSPTQVSSGDAWGVLVMPTSTVFYKNGSVSGTVTYTSGSAAALASGLMCMGIMNGTTTLPVTVNSLKVWR